MDYKIDIELSREALEHYIQGQKSIGYFADTLLDAIGADTCMRLNVYMKVYCILYELEFDQRSLETFKTLLDVETFKTLLYKHYDSVSQKHSDMLDYMLFDLRHGNDRDNIMQNEKLDAFIISASAPVLQVLS